MTTENADDQQLIIRGLRVAPIAAPDNEILKGIDLTVGKGEVLRALEGPIAPMFCASDDPEHALICDRSARCTVNLLWVRVRDAVTSAVDSMTLADLVPLPGTPAVTTPALTGAVTPS